MSNRTRMSPFRTASPSAFGSSAMRAGAGATTVNSAPGAGITVPVAAIVLWIASIFAASTATGTGASVSTCSTEAR